MIKAIGSPTFLPDVPSSILYIMSANYLNNSKQIDKFSLPSYTSYTYSLWIIGSKKAAVLPLFDGVQAITSRPALMIGIPFR